MNNSFRVFSISYLLYQHVSDIIDFQKKKKKVKQKTSVYKFYLKNKRHTHRQEGWLVSIRGWNENCEDQGFLTLPDRAEHLPAQAGKCVIFLIPEKPKNFPTKNVLCKWVLTLYLSGGDSSSEFSINSSLSLVFSSMPGFRFLAEYWCTFFLPLFLRNTHTSFFSLVTKHTSW